MTNTNSFLRGAALLIVALFVMIPARAGNEVVTGSWEMATESPDGEPMKWKLMFEEKEGALSGHASNPGLGHFELKEVKFDGTTLEFVVLVEGGRYTVNLKVADGKAEGKWTSGQLSVKTTAKKV